MGESIVSGGENVEKLILFFRGGHGGLDVFRRAINYKTYGTSFYKQTHPTSKCNKRAALLTSNLRKRTHAQLVAQFSPSWRRSTCI